jgi:hypothetical protein
MQEQEVDIENTTQWKRECNELSIREKENAMFQNHRAGGGLW